MFDPESFTFTAYLEIVLFYIIIPASLILGLICLGIHLHNKSKEKLKEESEQRILKHLKDDVKLKFAVDLETIYDIGTQNEIVRLVNLLASRTAEACTEQSKKKYNNSAVSDIKKEWSEARKLALQICPELADRLPHFSEFEPLKSYNAEHLLQKKAKDNPKTQLSHT